VETVQEVIRYQETTRVPLASGSIGGLINLRGQVITALDLRHRLGMEPRPEGQLPMNVVVRTEDGAVSLLVDQIGEVIETDARHFELSPDTVTAKARELIRGAYKLDDACCSPSTCPARSTSSAPAPPTPPQTGKRPCSLS
jgi:purine-binding chemotaxis protein CheW